MMLRWHAAAWASVALVAPVAWAAPAAHLAPATHPAPADLQRFTYQRVVMGSPAKLVLYAPDEPTADRAAQVAFKRLAEVEEAISDWQQTSQVRSLPQKAGERAPLGPDLAAVIQRSQQYWRDSGGAFDPTVLPLVQVWRAARKAGTVPAEADIAAALKRVGMQHVQFTASPAEYAADIDGLCLDFGGIGQGYGGKAALDALRAAGVTSAMIDLSGDVFASDAPPGTDGWHVQVPEADGPGKPATFVLRNAALTVSGATFQHLDVNGASGRVRYSHIIDPRTGWGISTRRAVVCTAPDPVDADALATALSVLGPEKGQALLATYPSVQARWFAEEDPAGQPACDWQTTGLDCQLFAAGDVDGDGWVDLLTINGNRDLCWAPSVHGWKSGTWRVLAGDVSPAATQMHVARTPTSATVTIWEKDRTVVIPLGAGGKAGERTVTGPSTPTVDLRTQQPLLAPPPYEPGATRKRLFSSGFAPEGGVLAWEVFQCTLPNPHMLVRNAVVGSPTPQDQDADGLTDAEEAALGTDPRDRDTDGDGLLDGWEVHGLPADRVPALGPAIPPFDANAVPPAKDQQLDPRRKDVIVNASYFEQVKCADFEKQIPQLQAVYRGLHCSNPDGTTGVRLHVRSAPQPVPEADQRMAWWDVGAKHFPRAERGLMHWMQVTPGGGGQSSETGDMGGCGCGWAVFAHELGHQLGLSHTGDSAPGWCPLYPSLMNYAYSYSFDGDGSKPHFSSGEFRNQELDEHHLTEKLPFAYERVKFLANHPFRFTLKDNGDGTTLIDWNHNGQFDTEPVVADINYGGSTQAGERKTHTLIGSAPSLAYIGDTCYLAAATHKQNAVTLKAHTGNELWTPEVEVPSSSTRFDPVLIGGPDAGTLLVRRFDAWAVATVRAGKDGEPAVVVGPLVPLPALGATDVSGIQLGSRVLLLVRHDSGALEARWLTTRSGASAGPAPTPAPAPTLGPAMPLQLTSAVPPGLALNPGDQTITVVGSATHPKHGPFTMHVAQLKVEGDTVTEAPPQWTHGGRPCHCTSRPVAVYPAHGGTPQLTIFHTGWTDSNGTWTGWRTQRVGNTALDDGWLTSQLYDEWTRSRVALGFADGAQGAFYAFRWDPGDHRDWKVNTLFVAHGGYGIDDAPMRDFDDGAKIGLWGIRHSILLMPTDTEFTPPPVAPATP